MARSFSPAIAAAIGAAGMYYFDPERGRRRRMLVRDQAVHGVRKAGELASAGVTDLAQRSWGIVCSLVSALDWREPTDEVLIERVRAKIGRYVEHPKAIDVTAHFGEIVLSGHILRREHERLLEAVRSVRGVQNVTDRLIVHASAEGVSELQGGRPRRGERLEVLEDNWSPGVRMTAMAGGTALALAGLRRGGLLGSLAGGAGALLFLRGATNTPMRRLVGFGDRRGIEVQKTITIDAPVETVFAFLSSFENYPCFMRNVRRVEARAHGQTHWVVEGPAGAELHWDSVVTQYNPNELLAWRTLEGSPIAHAGSIRFQPLDGATRVHIHMHYNPPAGALGHAVARLFGLDAKSKLDEDMMRLKTTIETGRTPHDAAAKRACILEPVPG